MSAPDAGAVVDGAGLRAGPSASLDPDWLQRAACRGMPVDLFYPEHGQGARHAKAVCATCPVRAECLQDGLYDTFGVRGGLSAKERRRLRGSLGIKRNGGLPRDGLLH